MGRLRLRVDATSIDQVGENRNTMLVATDLALVGELPQHLPRPR
jgi:hypothetical protein